MTSYQRLRRTAILCLHCIRNVAYYRAWNAADQQRRLDQFWITINANCIDIAVLEWCKLFGDLHAQHHWSKSVTDHQAFLAGLYSATRLSEAEFEQFRVTARTYRDKFVAHLDMLNRMDIPRVQVVLNSVRYLYQYLLDREVGGLPFVDAPADAKAFYQAHLDIGRAAHKG